MGQIWMFLVMTVMISYLHIHVSKLGKLYIYIQVLFRMSLLPQQDGRRNIQYFSSSLSKQSSITVIP